MRARILLAVLALVAVACGSDDQHVARKTGSDLGKAVTEFTSGVKEGVGTGTLVTVELSQSLLDRGLSKTVSRSLGAEPPRGFTIYLIAKNKLAATLIAKAMTGEGQEIGRSREKVSFDSGDARYVTFNFPAEMEVALVAKYTIDAEK